MRKQVQSTNENRDAAKAGDTAVQIGSEAGEPGREGRDKPAAAHWTHKEHESTARKGEIRLAATEYTNESDHCKGQWHWYICDTQNRAGNITASGIVPTRQEAMTMCESMVSNGTAELENHVIKKLIAEIEERHHQLKALGNTEDASGYDVGYRDGYRAAMEEIAQHAEIARGSK